MWRIEQETAAGQQTWTYFYPLGDIREFGQVSRTFWQGVLPFAVGFSLYFVPVEFLAGMVTAKEVTKSVIAINPVTNHSERMEEATLEAIKAWVQAHEAEFVRYNETAPQHERMFEFCFVGSLLGHISGGIVASPEEWLRYICETAHAEVDNILVEGDSEGGYHFYRLCATGASGDTPQKELFQDLGEVAAQFTVTA